MGAVRLHWWYMGLVRGGGGGGQAVTLVYGFSRGWGQAVLVVYVLRTDLRHQSVSTHSSPE